MAYTTASATATVAAGAPAAAVTNDALTWTTPSAAPAGTTYTLKSATPEFAAAGATGTAATFGAGATIDAAGKLSIPASDANLAAANKGTYTWTVTVKAPGYEDKDVTYVLTVTD